MQQILKVGGIYSFTVSTGAISFVFRHLNPADNGFQYLDFEDVTIDVEGYFHGSIFDLWLFQHCNLENIVKPDVAQDLESLLMPVVQSNSMSIPLFTISLPLGRQVTIRLNSLRYPGIMEFMEIVPTMVLENDFRKIKFVNLEPRDVFNADVKKGVALFGKNSHGSANPYSIVQYGQTIYTALLQNGIFMDSFDLAVTRQLKYSIHRVASNYTFFSAYFPLLGGKTLLSNVGYDGVNDDMYYNLRVFYQE